MYIPLTFEGSQAKCLYAEAGPGGYNGSFISGSDQYNYHLYTGSVGTLNVSAGTIDNVTILIVGGGGGGGTNTFGAQGGGGGQVKFLTNQRLYTGTYSISIGGGGIGFVGATSRIGNTGGQSSFSGSNLFISASGGGGGGYYGNSSGTGVSGNGFAGGTPIATSGGGGGGAVAVGGNGSANSNGGDGYDFVTAGSNRAWSFGCGGGGSGNNVSSVGTSCNGGAYGNGAIYTAGGSGGNGMPYYGMGGGGGNAAAGTGGGYGGSGVIYIQYKINSYCKNNYNHTGSCGCREITFISTVNPANLDVTYTGSYAYVPCYGTQLVTGSIRDEYQTTVCAMSGTFFMGPNQIGFVTGSTGNALAQCSTGSSCLPIPEYTSSCSSSIYTYFGAGYTYYVPRNSTSINFASVGGTGVGNTFGRYVCQSTISTNPFYSDVVVQQNSYSGPYIDGRLSGAQCVVLGFTRTIATGGNTYIQTLYYWDQFGVKKTVTKTYSNASPTWTLTFTTSFANGAPYFTSTDISPNELYYLSTANEYTSSGLPTCGCP